MAVSLSMPLFVAPADVILRMQLDEDLEGISDVMASGIIAAQLHVQRVMDGELSRRTRTHTFFLDAQSFSGLQPGGVFRLEIPSGFIREDTDVVVTATPPSTDGGGRFGEYTEVDTDFMEVDYERGYVLLGCSYANCFVKVTCDTGFEDGTRPLPTTDIDTWDTDATYVVGDQVVFSGSVYTCIVDAGTGESPTVAVAKWNLAFVPMEQIPTALYDAIMAMVPVVFDIAQTTNRSDEAEKQYKKACDHASILLQPFVRAKGFSFRRL